jgi:HKD family nuclease
VLPENEQADESFHSREYYNFMAEFDQELEELAKPVWDELKMRYGKISE